MKKIFAKLALFTIISIWLAAPLHAFADKCLSKDDKEKYITTIIEEPFGSDSSLVENGGTEKADIKYETRSCCRITSYLDDGTSEVNLNKGQCPTDCVPLTTDDKGIRTGESCEQVMAILSKGGTTMIEGYISTIYTWAAGLVGLIAVTVIIISGIQIAMSGGDTQAVESGKNRILKSLSGLAVLFLSGLILYTINPNFFTK